MAFWLTIANCNLWFTQTTKTKMKTLKIVNFASVFSSLKLKPF